MSSRGGFGGVLAASRSRAASQDEAECAGAKGSHPGAKGSDDRLHFVDWLRLVMVVAVVYAHTAMSGLSSGGGFDKPFLIDDITLDDVKQFRDEMQRGGYDGYNGGPAPYASRWICIVRQWCLPVLFWVSGAAIACSYRGGCPRGMGRLAMFTALGMSFNAVLWFASPQEKMCNIAHVHAPECAGKGLLLDFSICGRAGAWFAIMCQMWYTLVILTLSIVSWPLFGVTQGSLRPAWLVLQGVMNLAVYSGFVIASGDVCPDHAAAIASLAVLEALFQVLTLASAPSAGVFSWPDWLPYRLLHYLMAVVVMLQFGAVRWADEFKHVGLGYIGFISTGFGRFYNLGFIMTYARRGPSGDRAHPLASTIWPVMLFFIAIVSPSTNWQLAGMLTYPFYRSVTDRCLYIAGGLVMVFCVDRISRGVQTRPVPGLLATTSLALYLFHPGLITLILFFGGRDVMAVWLTSIGSCFVLVAAHDVISRQCCKRAADTDGAKGAVARELLEDGTQSGSGQSDGSSSEDDHKLG